MANDQDPPRRRFLKAGGAAGAALGAGSVAHAATKAQFKQPVDAMTPSEWSASSSQSTFGLRYQPSR